MFARDNMYFTTKIWRQCLVSVSKPHDACSNFFSYPTIRKDVDSESEKHKFIRIIKIATFRWMIITICDHCINEKSQHKHSVYQQKINEQQNKWSHNNIYHLFIIQSCTLFQHRTDTKWYGITCSNAGRLNKL